MLRFIRSAPHRVRGPGLGTGFLAAVIVVSAATSLSATPAAACTPSPSSSAVTFAYAGDSTTAKPDSWLHQVDRTAVDPVGGYAHDGWTSGQVLAKITPVKADVLVIMLGINDLHYSASDHFDDVVANVNRIAAKVGITHVIIAAVAPSNVTRWWRDGSDSRVAQTALNVDLKKDATDHNWDYTDPWAGIRAKDGGYLPGYSTDRIHPTRAGAAIVAKAMTAAIVAVAHPGTCQA